MSMRIKLSGIALVCAASVLALSGCLPSTVGPSQSQPVSVTLVLGANGGSLNPYSPMLANRQVGELVFSGLTDVGADGSPEPELLAELPTADNGGISKDGRTVRMRIRDDALWADGAPVTAADVAFTIGLLRDGVLTDEAALDYSEITTVRVVDDTRLELQLERANSPLVWSLAPYVLPEHLLADEPVIASADYWFKPVGSGPYRIESVRPGTELHLVPSASKNAVPIDVVFASTGEAARDIYDAASAAVWVDGPTETGVSGESVVATQSSVWRAWTFNQAKGSLGADPTVRRSYMAMMPMEATSAVPAADPFGLPLSARSLAPTRTVAGWLRDDGWRMGKDEVLVKDGAQLAPVVATRTFLSEDLTRFESISSVMGSVGLAYKTYALDNLDMGGWLERDYLGVGEWDVARTRIYVGSPLGVAWPFESDDVPSWANPYGGNFAKVSDETLDRRYDALRSAGTPEQAKAAWRSLGKRLNKLGVVYWEYPETTSMLVKGVEGVEAHASLASVTSGAPAWRLAGSGPE